MVEWMSDVVVVWVVLVMDMGEVVIECDGVGVCYLVRFGLVLFDDG